MTVDEQECTVVSSNKNEIVCQTPEKVGNHVPTNYVGQQGLKRFTFNLNANLNNWRSEVGSDNMISAQIWPEFNVYDSFFTTTTKDIFEGFFKAPATGDYRFLMSCDDSCDFKISTSDPMNQDAAEKVLQRNHWTFYRDTDIAEKTPDSEYYGQNFSDWIPLVKDQYYYVESALSQTWGGINLAVGMEIKLPSMPVSHSKLERQVQRMSLGLDDFKFDTLDIMVSNADDLYYTLAFMDDASGEYKKSDEIRANCDEHSMKHSIRQYYLDKFGTWPRVELKYLDVSG